MKRILVAACGLALASCAFANNGSMSEANSKVYVGGSLGYTNTHWDPTYNSTGFGFNVLSGYRFSSLWSLEGSFTHFATATAPAPLSSISTNSVAALAKMSVPLGQSKFDFFSRMGLGYTFTSGDVSRSNFGPVFGVGVGLPIAKNMNIEGSYTHFVGSYGTNAVPNADFYGATFTYTLPASLFS
jgi:hypothetical protein